MVLSLSVAIISAFLLFTCAHPISRALSMMHHCNVRYAIQRIICITPVLFGTLSHSFFQS